MMGKTATGRFSLGSIDVLTPKIETPNTLLDASESAVHELFHSLRLDHPFERIQTEDTKLFMDRNNKSKFTTAISTDPNIYYNIMNYNDVNINGKILESLWKYKRPEYITKQQIQFLLKEIDLQKEGAGTINKKGFQITNGELLIEVSESNYYWEYGIPGQEIDPIKHKLWKILKNITS